MTLATTGVDVSHHQDPNAIDYVRLAADGVEWCVARACYGVRRDETFVPHFSAAWTSGLKVGGYTFFRQEQDPEEQLAAFCDQLLNVTLSSGDILPVVDLEWGYGDDWKLDKQRFVDGSKFVIESLANKYGGCIVYLAPGFYQQLGSPAWLKAYPWWVAHYTQASEPWCPFTDWVMWQYTGKGRSPAYANGKLDLDMNRAKILPLVP